MWGLGHSWGSGAQDRECGSELKWDLVVITGDRFSQTT